MSKPTHERSETTDRAHAGPTDDIALPVSRQRHTPARTPSPLTTLTPSPDLLARSLYIHIPFCEHKCHYCDFYSIVDRQDRQPAFTDRLRRELDALAPFATTLDTIFVGGGTPTLLAEHHWHALLTTLHDAFDLTPDTEFTVECNPESATESLFAILAEGGVNRLSMGAQSFNPRHLKALERLHNPDNVPRALELAANAGIHRRSIDLIFGIPTQTLAEWQTDLDTALALGTEHLSCYDLTYEPNTAMTARLHRGDFEPIDEDTETAMFAFTRAHLREVGMPGYEVSNFATPGRECRHNLAYWRQLDWLAAGPSASAHIMGHRWKNTPRLDDYLSDDPSKQHAGFPSVIDHEPPDPRNAVAERIMTTLRLREGADARRALADAEAIDPAIRDQFEQIAQESRATGWLNDEPDRWSLTDAGVLVADHIASRFIRAVIL